MAIPSLTSIRTWVYNVLSGPILLIKVTNGKRRLRQDAHARVRLHPIPCQGGPCGQHAHTLTGAHGEPHTPAPLLALLCPLYRAQACVDDRACLRSQGCSHLGCTQENGGPQGKQACMRGVLCSLHITHAVQWDLWDAYSHHMFNTCLATLLLSSGGGHGVRCLQQPHREHPGPAVRCGDGEGMATVAGWYRKVPLHQASALQSIMMSCRSSPGIRR